MAYETYQKVTGIIQNIQRGDSCCTQVLSVMTENDTIQLMVTGETKVIDCIRLRRGMRIAAFYDGNAPAPAVYPPRYQAEIVTSLRRDQNVALGYFDDSLVAEDNSLKLNLGVVTNIETANGQRFLCSPGNADLLVYYTTTTFSIPPMTTPQRIVVMCPY